MHCFRETLTLFNINNINYEFANTCIKRNNLQIINK